MDYHVRSHVPARPAIVLLLAAAFFHPPQMAAQDDSQVRPPVTKTDLEIVKRAAKILDSEAKWNRADTRVCPPGAKTVSLYCALEQATLEVDGGFEHRGAAMQEARFVIDAIAPHKDYEHRLMGYNNDPATTFADIQNVLKLLAERVAKRLETEGSAPAPAAPAKPAVTKADLQIIVRARQILDSPAKWNHHDPTQKCSPEATTFGLYCALMKAQTEVIGETADDSPALGEARQWIRQSAPNGGKYQARLVDYNNDPATSFADIQKLLQLVEERLTRRMAEQSAGLPH